MPTRPAPDGSLLIVDDDARVRTSLAEALAGPLRVRTAASADAALQAVAREAPDVVLTDVRMPGTSGLELLALLRARAPEVDVVLMTAFDDLQTAAHAMREGAADFLVKPLDLHQLRVVLERVYGDRRMRVHRVRDDVRRTGPAAPAEPAAGEPPRLVGRDPRMVELFKRIGQLAGTTATVVIRGESGTGKELVARAIHELSAAAAEPFIPVNCAALPPTLLESELFGHVRGAFTGAAADRRGRFAAAGRGTIFLDEIGDTSPDFQAKLLRVLQEREYFPVGADRPERTEARVLAATHRDLEALVADGAFRQDLYYRLRVVELRIPPLRERRDDVPLLAEHLVRRASRAAGRSPPALADGALELLRAYDWPGNVRELENCLTRAVVLATGDVVRPDHLALGIPSAPRPAAAAAGAGALRTLDEVEREHIARMLAATGGRKTRAAEILGVSRPRLNRLLRKHGLEAPGTEEVEK